MSEHTSQALSVSAVAKFIQSIISQNISSLWIRGEISNFKYQPNGNSYFSIKDSESKLGAIIMANSGARKYAADLKNGMEVIIYGKISYYKKEGYLTVFVEDIEFLGEGLLKIKFDELKKKLEAEGLFAKEHKRKIPEYPRWVGVVTSPTGAAIQDILNVTSRRFGSVNILIFPAAVQGECAAREIADAVTIANRYASEFIDVLIVGRGGGSIEDLWCFNEEVVARAIYASEIPVISAVGHEIDYTIADYVADLRAPTPSAAAEIVVKDRKEILRHIEHMDNRLDILFNTRLENIKRTLEMKGKAAIERSLQDHLMELSLSLDSLKVRFKSTMDGYFNRMHSLVTIQKEKLQALNPRNILKRGYSITYFEDEQGKKIPLTSHHQVKEGDIIQTHLSDGDIHSQVQ